MAKLVLTQAYVQPMSISNKALSLHALREKSAPSNSSAIMLRLTERILWLRNTVIYFLLDKTVTGTLVLFHMHMTQKLKATVLFTTLIM